MKVAIAGYGVEGRASYEYYKARGHEVVIADERPDVKISEGGRAIVGPNAFKELGSFDAIIRSPGIDPDKLPYGDKVWTATNEFFAQCPAQIIGVTGTKGKGTTSSLIASILRAASETVHLVGNIGTPALEMLGGIEPDDIVVYELSSFQLWDLQKSPHVAVVLMVEPDHLDVHADFNEYFYAKMNIAAKQTSDDIVVYNKDNEWSRRIAEASPAQRFVAYPFELGKLKSRVQLPGAHNLENAAAAVAVARIFTSDEEAIAKGLEDFTGLPHRLKFVRDLKGVKFYDDSISTTPGSAIAALKAFKEPKAIILGGSEKGAEYEELVAVCKKTKAHVVAIGKTGARIAELCREQGVDVTELGTARMSEVVQAAYETVRPKGVVLLSPASASFDMFENYAERGEKFIAAVSSLGAED